MELKLTILGCGSAAPSLLRANTAQILEIGGKVILIDCGEGTQVQLLKQKISAYKIDIIFISHLHGDHIYGLPGLLTTLSLYGRETPLKIFGPKGIKKLLFTHFNLGDMSPSYPISITEITSEKKCKVFVEGELTVSAIPLEHRISCYGYHFEYLHQSLKLEKQKCDSAGLGIPAIKKFKEGLNYQRSGTLFNYKDFTTKIKINRSYTYLTDTLYLPHLASSFLNTNILYHESTYLSNLLDKAVSTYHSTAVQAAEMAKLCNAGLLILGHFSSRYVVTDELLSEARTVFTKTELAEDGKVFILK